MSLVYFMRRADGVGPFKIGCTKFPLTRLAAMQLWSPEPLEIVTTAPGTFKDENRLHREFAAYRTHGEWFEATRPVLAAVARVSATGALPPPQKDDKWERIADLYRAGSTLKEIGDQFGVTRERIRQILRKAGVKSVGYRPRKDAVVTPEAVAEMMRLAPTCSVREISERLDVAAYNVRRHLSLNGFKAKRGRKPRQPATVDKAFAVAADYKIGLKTREIAEKHGIEQPHIYRLLRIAGVTELRGRSTVKTQLPAAKIAERYEAGESLILLAAAYGVTEHTIRRRVVDQGVKIRGRIDAVNRANAKRKRTPTPEATANTRGA